MNEFKSFFRALWKEWHFLMSGTASILLAALSSTVGSTFPAWSFWVVGIVCLFIACFRAWRAEFRAKKAAWDKLSALEAKRNEPSPQAQNEATVRAQLANLARAELLALKHLVLCGQLTEVQLADFCRSNGLEIVTPGMLSGQVSFLTRNFTTAAWSVIPLMEPAARAVLSRIELQVVPTPGQVVETEVPP